VGTAGLFYGLMLAASLAWAHWMERPLFYASARAARVGVDWGADTALGLGAAVLLVVASRMFALRTRSGARSARALAELLGPVGLRAALWLGVVSGVAEEALFRGVVQVETGWILASLLFGLAHLAPRRDLVPWTANALVAGFLLGALFDVTGNLLAPVLTHSVVNALNLRWLSLHFAEPGPPPRVA
jgi:membrane protease YdiL (CAAX protease family)